MTDSAWQPPPDLLRHELCALARALRDHGVPLIVGGGYGLLLRQAHIAAQGAATLRSVPPARATEDLDLYLSADLLVDAPRVEALRDVLVARGYTGVTGALYYQFSRVVDYLGQPRTIKVDLLAPLPQDDKARAGLKYDRRRVRPRAVKHIHAHTSPEALTIADLLLSVHLVEEGERVTVYLPHPYTVLVLKLHAYRDRREDERVDYGRHHAFDLYRTMAMATEPEWEQALGLRDRYHESPPVREARAIVQGLFSHPTTPGALAIREHARDAGFPLTDEESAAFLADLHVLFPA